MARYIDADSLIKTVNEFIEFYNLGMLNVDSFVEAVVDMLPTADVVEVVRCKDCTRQLICYHSDDYYCADGERREE